ncbi:MAG: MBL fold metallo-hydrolase [Anaerolineaceae bacterium]
MSLSITVFTIGPIENNSFLLIDKQQKIAAIIDPSFGSKQISDFCEKNHFQITNIFCTHAHFDHIAGLNEIQSKLVPGVKIWLHPDELPLWKSNGGANHFNFPFEICCQPTDFVSHLQMIPFGDEELQVRFTPGHTPGHVVYYLASQNLVFCGDLVFRQSIGRTDLVGGNQLLLLQSIDLQIKTLPDQTRLLSGHGPETTVGYEKKYNPFF